MYVAVLEKLIAFVSLEGAREFHFAGINDLLSHKRPDLYNQWNRRERPGIPVAPLDRELAGVIVAGSAFAVRPCHGSWPPACHTCVFCFV